MRRLRFAIFGFGNVGRALARQVAGRRADVRTRFDVELELAAVVDRGGAVVANEDATPLDGEELARFKESGRPLSQWRDATKAPSIAELRGRAIAAIAITLPTNLDGGEPGLSLARAALEAKLHVALADKGPPLFALPELEQLAARRGRVLGTSATTGSALPSLAVLRGWLAASRVDEIRGVLNGTSNLILTRLREPGASYDAALAEAQRTGAAEPDPRLDVEGFDTAIKLVILARGLIDPHAELDRVVRRGITGLAAELLERARRGPERLRLVGRAVRESDGVRITVAPELVAPGDVLFDVEGTRKAVTFRSEDLGEMSLVGGASSLAGTASALQRDLIAAARA
jgi:homoserine dehydrogenase